MSGYLLLTILALARIVALVISDRRHRRQPMRGFRECPYCAIPVREKGGICPHCGHAVGKSWPAPNGGEGYRSARAQWDTLPVLGRRSPLGAHGRPSQSGVITVTAPTGSLVREFVK
jgi:hypothetical protein